MGFVYVVRCNFNEPAKEADWNAWYSGPKIAQMLRKPHFRSCQRFKRAAGGGRDYLALWTLGSPEAFQTEQYTADWGFFEWAPHITHWSRDLFDGGDIPQAAFAVPTQGGLAVVSFDGSSLEAAAASRATLMKSHPDMLWLPIAGLDRHTPLLGLQLTDELTDRAGAGRRRTGRRPASRRIYGRSAHLRRRRLSLENTTATCHVLTSRNKDLILQVVSGPRERRSRRTSCS